MMPHFIQKIIASIFGISPKTVAVIADLHWHPDVEPDPVFGLVGMGKN